MKVKVSIIIVLIFVISSFLSSCAAFNIPVPPENTVYQLSQAGTVATAIQVVLGKIPDAKIMIKDNNLVAIMWPIKQMGWASVFIDIRNLSFICTTEDLQKAIGQANIFNSKNMGDFVSFMSQQGFKDIDPKTAPPALATALKMASTGMSSLPTLFVVILPAAPPNGDWLGALYPVVQQ